MSPFDNNCLGFEGSKEIFSSPRSNQICDVPRARREVFSNLLTDFVRIVPRGTGFNGVSNS